MGKNVSLSSILGSCLRVTALLLQAVGRRGNKTHGARTLCLLSETFIVFAVLATLTRLLDRSEGAYRWPLPFVVIAQGLWIHRLYVVAHEASHGKLWPAERRMNDFLGQLMLLPLLVPLNIHRKIHAFHHGHNRRDHHTSALDTFVVHGRCGFARRAWYHLLWYLGVFAGGWFFHSLISVVFFLFLPLQVARKVSPAFKGWRRRDQLVSLSAFAFMLVVHLLTVEFLGVRFWTLTIGWPLLVFAWCYSLLIYIYHYRTGYGPDVKAHVVSLRTNAFLRWWLLGFSDHVAHHREPRLPWYELVGRSDSVPQDQSRQASVAVGILRQFRGPNIVELPQ